MNNARSAAKLSPLEKEALARGLKVCLPLTDALPWPYPCAISYVNNAGILFTPAKIGTLVNEALMLFALKHQHLTPRKFVPLRYVLGS